MSKRYFWASSRIEQRLASVDGLPEVWVLDGRSDNQVHGPLEELLKGFQQAEVSIRVRASRELLELDEKVQIALAGAILARRSRTEEFEALDVMVAAELLDGGPALRNLGTHDGFSA